MGHENTSVLYLVLYVEALKKNAKQNLSYLKRWSIEVDDIACQPIYLYCTYINTCKQEVKLWVDKDEKKIWKQPFRHQVKEVKIDGDDVKVDAKKISLNIHMMNGNWKITYKAMMMYY